MGNYCLSHNWVARTTAIFIALYGVSALAGPNDVPSIRDSLGTLQPEHILQLPAERPDTTPHIPAPPQEEIEIEAESGISISDISSTTNQIGTLRSSESGYESTVWQYLDINEARGLLQALPKPITSQTLREAVVRLLLTEATPPRQSENIWLLERADALLRIGKTAQAASLLNAVPESMRESEIIQPYVHTMLLDSQTDRACDMLEALPKRSELYEASFNRLELFCYATAGEYEKAELVMNLRHEQGNPYEAWFTSLLESMHYEGTRMSEMPESPGDIDLAMLLSAGSSRLPKDTPLMGYLDQDYLPYHQLMASNEHNNPGIRASYMEQLIANGNGNTEALAELYSELAKRPSNEDRGLIARAKAYQALVSAPNTRKALQAFNEAQKAFTGHPLLSERLLLTPLKAITLTMTDNQPYLAFAPKAFRILTRAGETDLAKKWLRIMDVHRPQAPVTYLTHELARFIAETRDPLDLSPAARSLPPYTLPEQVDSRSLRPIQRYYRLAELFGYQPPETTQAMVDEKSIPQSGEETPWNVSEINDYTDRGSIAGVLLTASALQAESGWEQMDDESIAILVEALIKLGYRPLAKLVVVESILSQL